MRSFSHPKAIAAVAAVASIGALAQLTGGAQATEQCPPGVSPPSPYCRNVLPVAVTGRASFVHANFAILHGTAGPGVAGGDVTHYKFEYGRTKRYGLTSATKTVPQGPAAANASALIGRLRPGTRYHYRIVAFNTDGTTNGRDRTFRSACYAPRGRISGLNVGELKLGMTRRQAQQKLPVYSVRGHGWENFCLTPGPGIRGNVASPKQLSEVPARNRSSIRDRFVVLLTSNKHYQVNGVKPGTSLSFAMKKLHLGPVYHVGGNDWYLAPDGPADVIVKVRKGKVEEIGLANKELAASERMFLMNVG